MLPKPVMKSLRFPVAHLALAFALVIPGLSVASPSASVDGSMETSEGFRYDDGATSPTLAVSIAHSYSDGVLSFMASAGGGSISGGANPFIAISTYASNNGAFRTSSGAHAGTWSSFYVGTKPGFSPPAEKMYVPVKVHYTSTLMEQFGKVPASWNTNEPDKMAFYLDSVNWRPYNEDGYLSGNFYYGDVRSVGIYTSLSSITRNDIGPGAWARADLYASITPYVDPAWNAEHGNGYKVFYVGQVPEPETYGMMMAGLGLIGFLVRRRKLNA